MICGNYLAKAGRKVAIFEQHSRVGGCCSSFSRSGFVFDAGVHSLGDLGPDGVFRKIIRQLGLEQRIKFIRPHHFERIVFPEFTFTLGSDAGLLMNQLKKLFPKEEKNIDAFFVFINENNSPKLYACWLHKTFKHVLDYFFRDANLKKIFYCLVGPQATAPFKFSAINAIVFFKQWILDGGYYPCGGMQRFSDTLADRFRESGGQIYCSVPVSQIIVRGAKARGVRLAQGGQYAAAIVVSNADARQTLLQLVGKEYLPTGYLKILLKLVPTDSCFSVFLALDTKLKLLGMESGIWYMRKIHKSCSAKMAKSNDYLLLFSSSLRDPSLAPKSKDALNLSRFFPYGTKQYWKENKEKIADKFIKTAEELLPGLSKHILFREIATPETYGKYTLNYRGAIAGWAVLASQDIDVRLNSVTPISNLFLSGHWTRSGGGVDNVAKSGAYVAQKILLSLRH